MPPDRTGQSPPKPSAPPRSVEQLDAARAFAIHAARLLADDKCEDVIVLDVHGISQVADFLVIGTGTSERQMRAVLDHVEELAKDTDRSAFRTNRDTGGVWLLADYVDVVVHIFEPNTRALYDLEMLWGDKDRIAWQRRGEVNRDRAGLGDSSIGDAQT